MRKLVKLQCVLVRAFFREITAFISRLSSFNDFSCLFCRYGEALLRIGGLSNSKFECGGDPTQAIKGNFINKKHYLKKFFKKFNFFSGRCLVLQKSLRRSFAIGSCVTKVKSFFPQKNAKKIPNCLLFLMLSQKNM